MKKYDGMKKLVLFVMAFVIAGALASTEEKRPQRLEDIKFSEEFLQKTGGIIFREAGDAKVLVADARADKTVALNEMTGAAGRFTGLPLMLENVAPDAGEGLLAFARRMKCNGIKAVIVVADAGGDVPRLAAYPEEAIAVVDCTTLNDADTSIVEKRMKKEFFRALGFAMGAYSPQSPGSVMAPVFNVAGIDAIRSESIGAMQLNGISKAAEKLGLGISRPTTYKHACELGWAPAPTNEYQRVIWERINSAKEQGPANRKTIKKQ